MYLAQLWKFSRPHTIIGTTLSVLALYALALETSGSLLPLIDLIQLAGTWLACICGNIYIVGLNQLYDVEIDRINKPDLPLASGKLSIRQGKQIVIITSVLAILISAVLGKWLFVTVGLSLIIGTAYSLPPVRFKQYPLLAAICILTVRGCIVNLGLFAHFRQVTNSTGSIPEVIWILTLFILIFTIAIAVFKDVPDLAGDLQYQIQTFTMVVGKQTIFTGTRWVITIAYLELIVASVFVDQIHDWLSIAIHTGLIGLLWWRSQNIDLEQQASITDFYQFIWKLFFLEYLIFPLVCLR